MNRARDPSATSGQALRRLIDALVDAAQRDVQRLPSHHEAVATHQLRVRMKKLLALLRLGRDCIPDHTFEAMRMHIRAVKNACAVNRDHVVRDKLVEKLSRRFHIAPKHKIGAVCKLPQPSTTFLQHQLCALGQLIETTRIDHLTPEQIIASHAITYRKGRRLMKEAYNGERDATLHRWRHRVKDLHYQTLALVGLPGSAHRVRRARKLGRLLGRERDLANLAKEPAYAVKRGAWSHLIHEHRSQLLERILLMGHKMYNPAPQHFHHKMEKQLQTGE
jgi:hypothetical protein